MPEDRQPGSGDQPEDEPGQVGDADAVGGSTPPPATGSGKPASPNGGYQLGGGSKQPGGQDRPPENPFEALFSSFGGAGGGAGDMSALMQQLQNAFTMMGGGGLFGHGASAPAAGSGVNWDVTKDIARKTVASLGPDPTPSSAQQHALTEAVSIAEVWLDQATAFPRISTGVAAWSRAAWVENTMDVWRRLVEPVASHIADAMEGALSFGGDEAGGIPGMAGMEQMLRPMLRSSGASMFGLQLGQGLGQLAAEVVGATDIGLPLSEPGHVALLPTNVAAFGEGLEQTSTDVTLYLALRECARQRLFASAGWLREQVLVLVEQYAAGITIDTSALEQAVSQIDPTNLEELSASLEGGLFEPRKTPEQLATLERLETMLALVEGWVDDVVTQATAPRMPAAGALAETVRRSRASGGPAEATFATLVGLELRPRRMRDAANLWAALRESRGVEGRDAVWAHPDLVPTTADLDDPLGFVAGEGAAEKADEDFDAALAELLDQDKPDDEGSRPA
ncbi:MAG: Collagen alpha 1(I) chain precursor [uncultured Friedmanniella sp.]|uniref:Collagen alpha 1(I) chain n=1 Tax=uncultured Friedmanniella sp. TaxID=335381 RepID=A0A6J4LLE0_9ACTN|nr:zinc-dependent metalloprotease [uncultured Friedmanniella sp.]CAA9336356.1 MAG: Collagen alpha 1(I) chain precursor [uncultured Friedmanniella sp.]